MRKFILLFVLVLLPFPGCDDSTESKNNVNNANNVNNSSNSNNTNNINNVNNVNNTNNINNSNNITCEEVYPVTEGTRVALFTTDYTSGSLSVVSMDGSSVKVDSDAALVHSDALGRSFDTELYVISRLGGDNIARFNPQTWSVATQFSTGPGTNPQDFAMVSQCKGYISLYADDQLLIVDPSVGAAEPILGAINLFEYSDEDGSPEASFMTLDDGILMVAIQNLVNYAPQGNGRIILVDTATDAVSGVIALNTPNPFTTLVRVPQTADFVVGTVNDFSGTGGGVELFSTADATSVLVVTTQELGGAPSEIVMADESCGFALLTTSDYETGVRRFCLDGTVDEWLLAPGEFAISGLLLWHGKLLLADTTMGAHGVRTLDPVSGAVSSLVESTLPPTFTKPFELIP